MEEISTYIDTILRLGFETAASAAESAINLYADDDGYPGDEVVQQLARAKLKAILSEQQSWERPTDAERLDAAFRRLSAAGILARHNYAPTRSWGLGDLREEAKHAAARGVSARGYVFYTSQDAEGLIDDGCLALAFGAFSRPGMTYAELAQTSHVVAQEIYEQLTEAGLEVDWDGGLDSTMLLSELSWKCPRDAASGHGILKNELIARAETAAAPDAPITEDRTGWPLTDHGEWWAVITLIALDGSDAAELALDVVYDSLLPEARASAHRGPGALDVVFPGFALAGRPVRLDLIAAPAQLLHVSNRRRSVEAADVVVAIVRDADNDFESVSELRSWIAEAQREAPLILLVDARAALTAVQQALKHAAMRIRDRVAAG